MTKQKIDAIIKNCVANQALEGLICTEEDKAAARRIVAGETTADAEIARVIAKYKGGSNDAGNQN